MRRIGLSLLAALLLAACAREGLAGANVYPQGAEGFWMGAAPPPGFYYVNYNLYYNARRFTDNSGRTIRQGPMADFKMDVLAQVSRFLYMSDKEILGANWGAHIFLIFQQVHIRSAGGNSRASGLGDTIIDPFILAWHWENLHITTGIDIYLPTGNYREGRLANLSANAFVYEPVLAVTYMTPVEGLTASAKFMYDFPQKNKDFTNPFTGESGTLAYGEEFHFDYSLDYMINENLKAGLSGYYYQQITKDRFNGVSIPEKGRVWALGPGFEYAPERLEGRMVVSLRSQFEMDAKNRPEGWSNWLRAVWVF